MPSGAVVIVSEKDSKLILPIVVYDSVNLEHVSSAVSVSQGGKIQSSQSFWVWQV